MKIFFFTNLPTLFFSDRYRKQFLFLGIIMNKCKNSCTYIEIFSFNEFLGYILQLILKQLTENKQELYPSEL